MLNIKNLEEIKKHYLEYFEDANNYIQKNPDRLLYNLDFRDNIFYIRMIVSNNKYGYYSHTYIDIEFSKTGTLLDINCDSCYDECIHQCLALIKINHLLPKIFEKYHIKTEMTSKDLIELFKKQNQYKEKAHLNVMIFFNKNYRFGDSVTLDIKIGVTKEYVLRNKINDFLETFENNEGEIKFGTNFTYNPDKMVFSREDSTFISLMPGFLKENNNYSYYNHKKYNFNNNLIIDKPKKVFDALRESSKPFVLIVENKKYNINIIETDYNPEVKLEKDNSDLNLIIATEDLIALTNDYSYVLIENKMYYLTKDKRDLLLKLRDFKDIKIDSTDIEDFNNFVLPNIRKLNEKIELSEDLKVVYNLEKPEIKLYFDCDDESVNCIINAHYGDTVFNVLEESKIINNKNIIRDKFIEIEAIEYIKTLGFEINSKNQFIITDEDKIIDFIENRLNQKFLYEIFVTDKLRDIHYIKRPNVKSMFSLGSDELLQCEFEIDNVNNDEIADLMQALRYKKKYYRLKNGNFVNLINNEAFNKMNNLLNTLDIDYKKLKSKSELKIPKFKALYIASQKENSFIKTNNEFDKFINNFNESKNKEISVPKPIDFALRDYQVSGIRWMINISNYGFGGILADEMGLGKTLQTIMFIDSRLQEDKNREILIVCPTSLIYNWEAEFKKFAPHIKVKVIAEMRKKREKIFEELKEYQVFITSYGLLREDIEKYKIIHYDTMIIDEAQAIKNIHSIISEKVKLINASNKFALTGTPIENSLAELYNIFDFIMPGYFGALANFQDKYNNILKEDNIAVKKEFNKLIEPFILRRKKKDVIKELPDKIEKSVVVEFSDEQKKIYLSEIKKINDAIKESITSNSFNKSKLVILQYLTRLRQLCISPSLYIEDYKGSNAKIEALIDLLKNAIEENHKILVFSQFTSALAIIKEELNKEKIKYYYLDGKTKASERLSLVNSFNEDIRAKVFLISLKAGGNGLNLTSADIVIHLDPWWNPAVENQATDRAHRIGQKNVVEVIKLIAKGTIEEKVVKLQEMKKELSEQIIEGKDSSDVILSKLSEEDILYLIANE